MARPWFFVLWNTLWVLLRLLTGTSYSTIPCLLVFQIYWMEFFQIFKVCYCIGHLWETSTLTYSWLIKVQLASVIALVLILFTEEAQDSHSSLNFSRWKFVLVLTALTFTWIISLTWFDSQEVQCLLKCITLINHLHFLYIFSLVILSILFHRLEIDAGLGKYVTSRRMDSRHISATNCRSDMNNNLVQYNFSKKRD